jgi:hypothetical protein
MSKAYSVRGEKRLPPEPSTLPERVFKHTAYCVNAALPRRKFLKDPWDGLVFEYAEPTRDRQYENRKSVLALVNAVWKKCFDMTMTDDKISTSVLVVLYRCIEKINQYLVRTYRKNQHDSTHLEQKEALSAARYIVHQDQATGTRTANVMGVASSSERQGHGTCLLQYLREHLCDQNIEFMKVDITRSIITAPKAIDRFMTDPVEPKLWGKEQPTENEAKTSSIQSTARTERVNRQLGFYKKCGFQYQITPNENGHCTEFGETDPAFSFSLVATTKDGAAVSNPRLKTWDNDTQLLANCDAA